MKNILLHIIYLAASVMVSLYDIKDPFFLQPGGKTGKNQTTMGDLKKRLFSFIHQKIMTNEKRTLQHF